MKTNELRIGNLLQPKERHKAAYGDNIAFVTSIYEDKFVVCNHYPSSWFEPIPLTEEWLLNFGFKSLLDDPELTGTPTESGQYIVINEENICLEVMFGFTKDNPVLVHLNDGEFNLNYIHQLQNLYFALTGEELEYNLQKMQKII